MTVADLLDGKLPKLPPQERGGGYKQAEREEAAHRCRRPPLIHPVPIPCLNRATKPLTPSTPSTTPSTPSTVPSGEVTSPTVPRGQVTSPVNEEPPSITARPERGAKTRSGPSPPRPLDTGDLSLRLFRLCSYLCVGVSVSILQPLLLSV
jgi:hypothetical protein